MSSFRGAPVLYRAQLPDGLRGINATLRVMERVARGGARSRLVKATAAQLRRGDRDQVIKRLFAFLHDRVLFEPDPAGIEHVRTPASMIKRMRVTGRAAPGDCDDRSTLAAALLLALGLPAGFVVMDDRPVGDTYRHVAAVTRTEHGRPVIIDAQETTEPGALPNHVARTAIYWLS